MSQTFRSHEVLFYDPRHGPGPRRLHVYAYTSPLKSTAFPVMYVCLYIFVQASIIVRGRSALLGDLRSRSVFAAPVIFLCLHFLTCSRDTCEFPRHEFVRAAEAGIEAHSLSPLEVAAITHSRKTLGSKECESYITLFAPACS